jgi:hypothetical protein
MFIDADTQIEDDTKDSNYCRDLLTDIQIMIFFILFFSLGKMIYEIISELMYTSIIQLTQYKLYHEQVARFC